MHTYICNLIVKTLWNEKNLETTNGKQAETGRCEYRSLNIYFL